MKDIGQILKSLGLVDSEVKTYLAALENGPGTVLDLTKQTRLSRQATYMAIESLTERGIMSSALVGKKHFYAAEHPDKLLAYAKRREVELAQHVKDLARAIPTLELQTGGEKPVVRVFEGKEGIRAIIDDMEQSSFKESVEITDSAAMYKILSHEDLASLRATIKKRGARIYGLYSGAKPTTPDGIVLPKEFSDFKSDIGIYGDKIALVTFEGKMFSILIESKALTKALRILFKFALKGAKRSK